MKVRVTHFEDPNRVSRVSSRSFSNPGDVLEITRATRNSFASIDWHFRDYQPDICSRIPFDSQRLFAFTAIISSLTISTKSSLAGAAKVILSNIDHYLVSPCNPSGFQLIINSFRISQTDVTMLILQGWLTLLQYWNYFSTTGIIFFRRVYFLFLYRKKRNACQKWISNSHFATLTANLLRHSCTALSQTLN